MILNIHVSNTYYSLVHVHRTHIYNNSNFSIFHYTIYIARFGSELNNTIDLYIFGIYSLTQKGLSPCDLSDFYFFPRIQKTTIDLLQSEVIVTFPTAICNRRGIGGEILGIPEKKPTWNCSSFWGHWPVHYSGPSGTPRNLKAGPLAGVTLSRIWKQMDTRIWKCSNSGLIVKTSGHSRSHLYSSCDRRLYFPGAGSNFVSEGKIFGMQKNWPKSSRRLIFELISCVHFALRKAIVMKSCQIVTSSLLLRLIIDGIGHFLTHEDNTKEIRSCPIVLWRHHDYVKPSQYYRVAIVL